MKLLNRNFLCDQWSIGHFSVELILDAQDQVIVDQVMD